MASTPTPDGWHKTACILCECNCGIEVKLGGEDGRRFERIRGDREHPSSRGYTCNKPLRLDHYQNGRHRLSSPLRRRADGGFEEIDWETAIREVAGKLAAVRDAHGGESIFYYGGGGQGNHLPGGYAGATLRTLGSVYRSSALAQEKTGEFWVNGRMLGAGVRGEFEHCEVALFVGKNPYQSHGFPRAREVLTAIAKDPARALVVIDPRRSETAALADIHLAVKPGRDAFCLAALLGVLVQEDLVDAPWIAAHTRGYEPLEPILSEIPVARYCEIAGVPEDLLRRAARRIASAESLAVFEDLGVQMAPHSTLNSWLEKLIWALTGNFAKPGAQYAATALVSLTGGSSAGANRGDRRSPVVGARIITGLVPCNVIADEILTDHPKRYRAMIVESGNPAHSLADSQRMREALSALDCLVVVDVAFTETARLAHYVLPAQSQYEKWEATFFNFDFPRNVFHLRRPVLAPIPGPLPEPEIHARLVEALGALEEKDLAPLRAAAAKGRAAFAAAFFAALSANPALGAIAPVVLYRSLGPTLPDGAASAALLWAAAHRCAQTFPDSVRRAGFEGEGPALGEALFDAILASPSGLVFSVDPHEESWKRVRAPEGRIALFLPELADELRALASETPPGASAEFPFVLSAGERRSFTANTIFRNPAWRRKDAEGALRMSPGDAARLGLATGSRARITTRRASAEVTVEVSDAMQPGHVSLPNGLGVDYPGEAGPPVRTGVAPNELTASGDRDWLAGTPWHKHVPARIEALA